MKELKEKYGVKISGSTLKRVVRMGREAKEDSSFTGDGKDDVRVDVVQQPSNSPDTNIWDIGAFNAHQKEFKRLEAFTNTKQRMMELVYKAWDKISWEVMDKSWACFFNNLRSIMQCRGDNNYKQAHNQGEKRQKDTGTAVVV